MLILSFIIFLGAFLGMAWMIFRRFPELSQIAVVHHKHFSFLGIDSIHILEYKAPAEILWRHALVFFEKTLRRIRWLVLKLDNIISRALEFVQTKRQLHIQHTHADMPQETKPKAYENQSMHAPETPRLLNIQKQKMRNRKNVSITIGKIEK